MKEPFDLLVIGGGINGAAIARDAAGRGWRVLLVEAGDLAGATSSASTKLIHGGLRYLEMYDFRLVREALKEREVMLATAQHLVTPLRFVLPHDNAQRPAWLIRLGLMLYDRIGGRISLPRSRGLRLAGTIEGAPLRPDVTRGFAYSDAWVDDSRLVIANARDAADRGAEVRTRCALTVAARQDDGWRAALSDGSVVHAKAIVNAAGPWVAEMLGRVGVASRAATRLIKGSHIIVPRLFEGDHAYILQNADRRIVFAIPYQHRFTLIGTTDVACAEMPVRPEISPEEVAYLCASVNRWFRSPIAPADVVGSFAGVRSLYDDGVAESRAVTRDYVLELDREGPPILSVFGGKITTARHLAEAAVDRLAEATGLPGTGWTAHSPLPGGGGPAVVPDWLPPAVATRMAAAYGDRLGEVIGPARDMADLGIDFGHGLTETEVRYLIDREWARSAEDILWRRSRIGLHITEEQRIRLEHWIDERINERMTA